MAFSVMEGRYVRGPDERLVAVHEDDLADPLGVVADPLEVADDAQGRDDLPQVGGHRLLRGDQIDAPVLQLPALPVDLGVIGDHLPGLLGVEILRGRSTDWLNGLDDHLAHLQ